MKPKSNAASVEVNAAPMFVGEVRLAIAGLGLC